MFDEKILKLLKENRGDYTSGTEIGKDLDLSRTAVWKHIEGLRKAGYNIEAVPSFGYKLVGSPDILTHTEIDAGLKTRYIGKNIHAFSLTDSTNTKAFELAMHGAPEGSLVVAESQRKGKGRLGRRWESPKEVNIYTSIILRPRISPSSASQITLLAAVAAARAIEKTTKILPDIKWPNDLLIRGKRVPEILMELDSEADMVNFIVLGIGIDVNMEPTSLPPDVANVATSLKNETGKRLERGPIIQEIGRASGRERGEISVVAGSLKKRRGHRRCRGDWSSDVCSSDLLPRDVAKVAPSLKNETGRRLERVPIIQ